MRTYLSMSNFGRALILAMGVTLMSVPRIVQGGLPLDLYIPAALVGMVLVAGAATAWSRQAGMVGLFPHWRLMLGGVGIAVLISLVAVPIQHAWIDPRIQAALSATGNAQLMALRYPVTAGGCVAVMLWSASFETLFFHAATLSFFARLTNRQWIAVALTVALRLFVSMRQMAETGVFDAVPLMLVSTGVMATAACVLFARTGLIPAMMLAAGLDLHLFLNLTQPPP